jgi:hypothetical protein
VDPRQRGRDAVLAKLSVVAQRAIALEVQPLGGRADLDGVGLRAPHRCVQGVLPLLDRRHMAASEIVQPATVIGVAGQDANGRLGEKSGEKADFGGFFHERSRMDFEGGGHSIEFGTPSTKKTATTPSAPPFPAAP